LNAAKKIILLLWLVMVASLGNASASTPGASENRVWQKSFETLATRQAEPLQTLGGHQENGGAGYDYAVDSLLAAEGTTALSPYRMTTAGETFSHYGYADSAASFEGGLRPGGFATSSGDLSGAEAQSGLALPRPTAPPNAVYTVTPQPGTWIRANPVAEPLFGQPGGLPEFQFPGGTGPGTVFGPMPIPPR